MQENEQQEQVTTEVTSVAKEEARTGEKIDLPSSDDLVARASASYIENLKNFNELFQEASSRGKARIMNSVLSLPTDGVPVYLQGDKEKHAFMAGQRVISDRFIITYYHIEKEHKAAQEKNEAEKTVDTPPESE